MERKSFMVFLVGFMVMFSCVTFNVHASEGRSERKDKKDYFSVEKIYTERIESVLENKDGNLSAQKIQKIRALKLMIDKEMILKEAEKKVVYMDLQAEFEKETLYVNAINSFIDQKYELKKKISKMYVDALLEIEQIIKSR